MTKNFQGKIIEITDYYLTLDDGRVQLRLPRQWIEIPKLELGDQLYLELFTVKKIKTG